MLVGCTTGRDVVTGTPRPAIDVANVVVYSAPPSQSYEVIAMVMSEADGKGQEAINTALKRLKERAAKLGANGLVFGGVTVNKHYVTYYGLPIAPVASETGVSGTAIYTSGP